MSRTHSVKIAELPVIDKAEKKPGVEHYIKVEVYYSLGGLNYFNYRPEPRGFYLSVQPITIEKSHGVTWESFVGFSGVKHFIVPCAKYSPKKLELAVEMAKNGEIPEYNAMISQVLVKSDLALA